MKKIIFSILFTTVTIFAYTITKIGSDDGVHYTFLGHCDGNGVFNGNSTPSLGEAYICGPIGGCFHAGSKEEGIIKACKMAKKKKNSVKYGYLKKRAYAFKKRKGSGGIIWALTKAPKGKIPHMDKVIMDSMMGGKYAVRRNADNNFKVRVLKKYIGEKLLQPYWKVKDSRDIFYVRDEDIIFR